MATWVKILIAIVIVIIILIIFKLLIAYLYFRAAVGAIGDIGKQMAKKVKVNIDGREIRSRNKK